MAFTLPQFINQLDRWTNPRRPIDGAPNYTNLQFQIYAWSKQANYWFDSTTGKYFPTIIIREPPAPAVFTLPGDILGKDTGFTDYPVIYLVLYKQVMHSGFPNRYQALYCTVCGRNGVPVVNPRP